MPPIPSFMEASLWKGGFPGEGENRAEIAVNCLQHQQTWKKSKVKHLLNKYYGTSSICLALVATQIAAFSLIPEVLLWAGTIKLCFSETFK